MLSLSSEDEGSTVRLAISRPFARFSVPSLTTNSAALVHRAGFRLWTHFLDVVENLVPVGPSYRYREKYGIFLPLPCTP